MANFNHLAVIAFCLSTLVISIDGYYGSRGSLSLDLINRDSPKSPFYNRGETKIERLIKAMNRSMERANTFIAKTGRSYYLNSLEESSSSKGGTNTLKVTNSSSNTIIIQPEISFYQGEYLIRIHIGYPPVSILAIADTGSDLIWAQCTPCTHCLEQEAPSFDPTKSLSYSNISCNTSRCKTMLSSHCSDDGEENCSYSVTYGDDSYSKGDIARELISLDSSYDSLFTIRKWAVIGCGRDNKGTFVTPKVQGIVGLGGGPLSMITQLSSVLNGRRFSYCLIPYTAPVSTNSSKLHFGEKAVVSGGDVQTTPLIPKTPKTFYFVTLEAVSVDDIRVEYQSSLISTETTNATGNMIVDSGTTLTLIPQAFFLKLETAVQSVVGGLRYISPPGFPQLCYYSNSVAKLPQITMHFTNADMKLRTYNAFVNATEEATCFTFSPITLGVDFSILGNMAQANFLVGYDQEAGTLSFKPADCVQDQ